MFIVIYDENSTEIDQRMILSTEKIRSLQPYNDKTTLISTQDGEKIRARGSLDHFIKLLDAVTVVELDMDVVSDTTYIPVLESNFPY